MERREERLAIKIQELIEYRRLPELLDIVENDDSIKTQFINELSDLQKAIYHLDHILESEWEIIDSSLEGKWDAIYNALRVLGIEDDKLYDYCKHIYKYQKHELEQRKGKSLLRLSMEYFYFYKSCDVKLLRRIIFDRYSVLRSTFPPSDWRWFDLVTEVNDDIEDLYEDIDTNNGNRFLLSIEQLGKEQAYLIYKEFLRCIKQAFDRKIKNKSIHPTIIELTFNELKKTSQLLEQRYREISTKAPLSGSLKVF
ncbi:MAG: hypothetical protein HKN68_20540 [Saprospiraceae bacterium]|nr:hypothetical protein [Saprospiraceae bacterium]